MKVLNPEFIIISTPSNTHLKIVNEVLKYKSVKLILCEKPLDIDYKKSLKITNKCDQNNINLFVNYIRRCDPGILKLKDLILQNEIKAPFIGNAFYTDGLINNASHLLNLFEFILGKFLKYELLKSYSKKLNSPNFLAVFEHGNVIFQSLDIFPYSDLSFELNCLNGKLKYENFGWDIKWYPVERDKEFEKYKTIGQNFIQFNNQMYKYQYNVLNMILEEFKGKKTELCTGKQALATIKTLNELNSEFENWKKIN